ncbi:protein DEPP1 [Choloepus didactylus]|uniref:protein DEPP1 n=1 Tax=Choloepus didactylus TaxID=27675 RepID=UPI00189E2A5B|nr:protein DEPP1 [Choloepus didactylus]
MRSRLLISVAHLPTIQETSEERLSGGPVLEPPPSPSLDDYVRSICQLAQPTSALDTAPARDSSSRQHRPSRACGKSHPAASLQDITAHFSGQQPPLPGPGSADPLDWLFGESQEKQPSTKGPLWRTGPSADSWGLRRQTDAGKSRGGPRGRLCEARAPGHTLARPPQEGPPSFPWVSALPHRACARSTLRTLNPHLPVILEL